MGNALPALNREQFEEELRTVSPRDFDLEAEAKEALWIHYRELLRWNPRLSLVGPGTADEIVQRHFGESLAALPHLPKSASILDAGSGGGFPGLVLAAAYPGLNVTLVEPRQKKWSFLNTVIRKVRSAGISLSCSALDARVENPLPASPALPEKIDIVTCRALALGPGRLEALAQNYPGVRFLLWSSEPIENRQTTPQRSSNSHHEDGEGSLGNLSSYLVEESKEGLLASYRVAQRIHLEGSRHRFIIDLINPHRQ